MDGSIRNAVGGLVLAASCAAWSCTAAGCALIVTDRVFVEQFSDERIQEIRDGRTTKRELLTALGPPAAVLETAPPAVSLSGPQLPGQVVYRYDADSESATVFCAAAPSGGGGCEKIGPYRKTRRLWVLIDGSGGKVQSHVEDKTEGRP